MHIVFCHESTQRQVNHTGWPSSTLNSSLPQSNRIFSERFSALLFAGLRHLESLRKPELAVLSLPLAGHQNAQADETQSSQTQKHNVHGVELWTRACRSHTWRDS